MNVNPFRGSRGAGARAHALLVGEPLLQLLPYSDPTIGVSLLGASARGKPILLLAYRGSRTAAEADLSALRARLHEAPGTMEVQTLRIGSGPAHSPPGHLQERCKVWRGRALCPPAR